MNINIDSARDTLCKNILIYGYCKYENKGCVFNHNKGGKGESGAAAGVTGAQGASSAASGAGAGGAQGVAGAPGVSGGQGTAPGAATAGSAGHHAGGPNGANGAAAEARKRFNFNTPSFQPSTPPATAASGVAGTSKYASSPKLKEIPTFIPEGGAAAAAAAATAAAPTGTGKKFNASSASFTPSFIPASIATPDQTGSPAQIHSQSPLQAQHTPGQGQGPPGHVPAGAVGYAQSQGAQGPGAGSGGGNGNQSAQAAAAQAAHAAHASQGVHTPSHLHQPQLHHHAQLHGSAPPGTPGLLQLGGGGPNGPLLGGAGPGGVGGPLQSQHSAAGMTPNPYSAGPPSSSEMYFQPHHHHQQHSANARAYLLQYHLYAPAPPPRLTIPLPPHETNSNQLFIPNDLREALTKKNEATLQTFPFTGSLPDHIGAYHSLVPLELGQTTVSAAAGGVAAASSVSAAAASIAGAGPSTPGAAGSLGTPSAAGSSSSSAAAGSAGGGGNSRVFGVPTANYKVFSSIDGNPYTLTKVENQSVIRIQNEQPFRTVKLWKSLQHTANVVTLHDAFTSMAFGGKHSSLVMVYDYYPNSNTVQEQHITRKLGGKLEPLNEEVLTSYVVQIACALVAIHERGLAARSSLDISKILVTSANRVRLGAGGIADILMHEHDEHEIETAHGGSRAAYTAYLQSEDLKRFGRLILDLSLLCVPVSLRDQGVGALRGVFSGEYVSIVGALLGASPAGSAGAAVGSATGPSSLTIQEFAQQHLSHKLVSYISSVSNGQDYLESQLSSELENARLFRLLTKIDFLIEKGSSSSGGSGGSGASSGPGAGGSAGGAGGQSSSAGAGGSDERSGDPRDVAWRENSPNYIIKLFRDYVFSEVNEVGKPTLNLSRVLTCLNKLDAGIDEKLLLVSDDERACIIVSYKEVKELIGSAFRSLMRN